MKLAWLKQRGYRHLDAAVGAGFAERVFDPAFVSRHSWLPLIHYVKRTKRYSRDKGKTVFKNRDIMYPSHRDACILAKYAADLTSLLDDLYERDGLTDNVIAYRRLGKSNYNFSAEAYRFASQNSPCVVLCFDITGFFDNLDHAILKSALKALLSSEELSRDWYAVFRQVTKYSYVDRKDILAVPKFAASLEMKTHSPIATISEIIKAGVPVRSNVNKIGIPQGTPISAALSNLYMLELDRAMSKACAAFGGLYQRYSDDILIICPPDQKENISSQLIAAVEAHKLEIKKEKTECAIFGPESEDIFQYLGFNMSRRGVTIRLSSLARQWRKAKRSIETTKKHGEKAIAAGRADKIFTKRLRKRFQPVGARNFSKYARRAADAFGSQQIRRQVLRFERMVEREIRELQER